MNKVIKIIIIYLLGLAIILGMCERAEQINKSPNNVNYTQNN